MSLPSLIFSSATAAESRFHCVIASFVAVNCCTLASWWYMRDCSEMREVMGAVTDIESLLQPLEDAIRHKFQL